MPWDIRSIFLANVPEVIDLARATRALQRSCFLFIGGHSASFIAEELLEHARGALDCVVKGEGIVPLLLEAARDDRAQLHKLPAPYKLRPPKLGAGRLVDASSLYVLQPDWRAPSRKSRR